MPTNPEERWVGTLVLEPTKSPQLRVTTLKSAFQFVDKNEAPSVIHGYDQSGKYITLFFPGWPRSHGGMALSQVDFRAGYAVLGAQFADHAEFQIHSLTFQMQYLLEWGGITGFGQPNLEFLHNIHIRYQRPEDQLFEIDSDFSVEIRTGYSLQNNSGEKILKEDLHIAFLSKQGMGLSHLKEFLNAIRHLLHFATLEPIYPLKVLARKNDHGVTHGEQFYPQDIEVCNSIIRERVKSDLLGDDWIFKFEDVQNEFGKFMAMWLEYLKKFDDALDCYFATVYHRPPHSIEHLSLTQALEAYHSIKFESHKDRTFADKIQELVEANKTSLIGLIDDAKDFATTVLHNRNYYTHYNPQWKIDGRIVSGGKLHQLNEKLRLVFQMCVLKDIGISPDRFGRLRRQLAISIIDFA